MENAVLSTIQKKLLGKRLNYKEIYNLMDEIAHNRLGNILTTYFTAAGYSRGFSHEELYYLTKAMVETGKRLELEGIVADKHSTGGLPGGRTSMILVPIIAACGLKIPKTSSRAITTPAGTADAMEVLASVSFEIEEVKKIVDKVGGCIIWGGALDLAPADDVIIKVEAPLAFESFDKIIVSIMAKKIAVGTTHLVLDIPVGPTMKVRHYTDAEKIAEKFEWLAKKFNIEVTAYINRALEPVGQGIGPVLEARDVLLVLQQKKNRPIDLENKAIVLAEKLLKICGQKPKLAREKLNSGEAWRKMQEIIKAQGGNQNVDSEELRPTEHRVEIKAEKEGRIETVDCKAISALAKILGCPKDKKAGMMLHAKIGQKVAKNEPLVTFYSSDRDLLFEAKETEKHMAIYGIQY